MKAPPIYPTVSKCRQLVPDEWRKGVPSAPLPQTNNIGELAAFGDAQTGQLDIANSRFMAADDIQVNCEKLLAEAAEQLKPEPWWKFW